MLAHSKAAVPALLHAAAIAMLSLPFATTHRATQADAPRSARSEGCVSCHAGHQRTGHPVGPDAKVRVATTLPLGAARTVACTTCHLPEGDDPAGRGHAGLRRQPAALCRSCHTPPEDHSSALFHAISLGRAHFSARASGRGAGLQDAVSHQCLTCHDGSAATSVVSDAEGRTNGHQPGHVLGTDYRDAQRRARLGLRHAAAIRAPVQLVDGKVGCVSCHSPFSGSPSMLQLPLRGGALCLACHDM